MLKIKGLLSQGIVFFTFVMILVYIWNYYTFNFLDSATFLSLNLNQQRSYSKSGNLVIPLYRYLNAKLDKVQIFKDSKGNSGIYRWINKENNKEYIGSANDLRARFYVYYSKKRLNSSKMIIYNAIKKYGHEKFLLEILEFCPPSELLERENYYIQNLKPEYNILLEATSSLGYKHSEQALDKMSAKRKNLSEEGRQNLSKAATGRVLSDETKAKSVSEEKNNILVSIPVKFYSNVEADKAKILKENRVKSGVYMFTNLTNGKKYIGSAIDLRNRFYKYYSIKYLESDNCMPICRALLKYGYHKFSLEILEYCKEKDTLIREKHYFNLFSPKYNISLDPTAPFLGLTHSDETRKQMSDTHTGSKHSDETRQKMSDTAKKINNSGYFKTGHKKVEGSGKPAKEIEVIDLEEKTTITYNSMGEAARALNLPGHSTISKYISTNQTKPYKDRYIFKKVN